MRACAVALAMWVLAAAAAAQAACAPGDPVLSGTYFLDGEREVGSEVRLYPDGQFEFALAYGALDQYGQGCWTVAGKTVTLMAKGRRTVPAQHTPLDRRFRGMWLLAESDGSLRWPLPGFGGVFRKSGD
jgi:hypothetical protein